MIWKLGVYTLEEAKERVESHHIWGDVTFVDSIAYIGPNKVGELDTTAEGEYYFTTEGY